LQKMHDVIKTIQKRWREVRHRAFNKRVRMAVPELFWGNKERRRDSVFRQYNGDYLKAKNSRMHKAIKKKYNERRLFFSDKVTWVEKGKISQKALIMTEGAFYTIGGKFIKKIQARIALQDISYVELSTLADGIVVLHMSNDDNDAVFDSDKKTELVAIIYEITAEIARERGDPQAKGVNVAFAQGNISYKEKRSQKTITFSRDEAAGTKTLIKLQGDTVAVSTATGLDRSAGPKRREKAKKPTNIRQITKSAGGAHGMKVIARAKAVHDYTARNARELSFRAGDVINVTQKSLSGTWQGELNGKTGSFPANLCGDA